MSDIQIDIWSIATDITSRLTCKDVLTGQTGGKGTQHRRKGAYAVWDNMTKIERRHEGESTEQRQKCQVFRGVVQDGTTPCLPLYSLLKRPAGRPAVVRFGSERRARFSFLPISVGLSKINSPRHFAMFFIQIHIYSSYLLFFAIYANLTQMLTKYQGSRAQAFINYNLNSRNPRLL